MFHNRDKIQSGIIIFPDEYFQIDIFADEVVKKNILSLPLGLYVQCGHW